MVGENIFEPLAAHLTSTTRLEEVNSWLKSRDEFYRAQQWNPVKYIWFAMKIVAGVTVLVRYTILYNEYIDEIKLYTMNSMELVTWLTAAYSKDEFRISTTLNNDIANIHGYTVDNADTFYDVLVSSKLNIRFRMDKDLFLDKIASDTIRGYLPVAMSYPIGLGPEDVFALSTPAWYRNSLYEYITVQLNALAMKGYWNYASRNLLDASYTLTDTDDVSLSLKRYIDIIDKGELDLGSYVIANGKATRKFGKENMFLEEIKRTGDL